MFVNVTGYILYHTMQKSNKPFRSCTYKVHGRTDGQDDSYIPPQTLFVGGINTNFKPADVHEGIPLLSKI
jgi:hypothetical protein